MTGAITEEYSRQEGAPVAGNARMANRLGKSAILSIGLALAILSSAYAQAQKSAPTQKQDDMQSDSLFAGTEEFAKGATKSTEVNLDKNMLAMAGKSFAPGGAGGQGAEAALASKMDGVFVRDYQYAKPGDYNMADVQKYIDRLNGNGWSHIVREHSATESTDVCFRGGDDGEPSEMVVISTQPDHVTFVHLKGHMSMNDLSKLGHNFGTPELKARPQ